MKILNLFKKREKHLGYWIMIEYSNQAKDNAVGFYFLKKIIHFLDGSIYKIENYSEAKIKNYLRKELVIIDRTIGQIVPKDSNLVPKEQQVMGTIQLTRRIR